MQTLSPSNASACTELSVYGSNEYILKSQIEILKEECDKATSELEDMAERTSIVEDKVVHLHQDLHEEHNKLSAEFEDLALEKAGMSGSGCNIDDVFRKAQEFDQEDIFRETIDEIFEDNPARGINNKTRRACKKVYTRISNLTHPDKVGKSEHLNDLYMVATSLYRSWDLPGLIDLLKSLTDMKSVIKTRKESAHRDLLDLVESYNSKIASIRKQIDEMSSSDFWEVVIAYEEAGIDAASDLYESKMVLEINILKFEIAKLKPQPTQFRAFTDNSW